jgi:simple sugar transport system permease protein
VSNLERVVVWSALFAAMLRFATPLLFAALGGVVSERSGVINIGLEGMMLMGAFWGIWGADQTGSWLLGLLIGMASGVVLAMIHAVWSITLRADQIVSGFSMNFLALGITGFFYVNIYGTQGTPEGVPRAPDVHLPVIEDIGFIGDIFGQLNILVWLGLITVFLLWLYLFRTSSGLRLRSVGENPLAAETAGLSPARIRYRAVAMSGALAAIGGAYLSIGFVGSFGENMTAGKGYIGLAVMICGRWLPQGALVFALLFGFFSALAQRLPVFSESAATLFQALPYVVTLIAVAGVVGKSIPPAADGRPLDR